MLRRKGVELAVLAKFCRAIIQVVVFFGADVWVLLALMAWKEFMWGSCDR